MAKALMLKPNCSFEILSTALFNSPMAMCSTFCPLLSSHLNCKPFSFCSPKPRSFVSFKVFSSQTSASTPKADDSPASIGFLGLGIMGSPMVQNLIKAGRDVTVWNRTKSKCEPLISMGAKYKSSPEEVAASCDITFAMLADPESAVDVACGKYGAAKGMGPGKGYIDVSTVDGETSKLICEHIRASGAHFLEALVSGSKKPAEDGQLIFLSAGGSVLYETVAPLLDIMGKDLRLALGLVESVSQHTPIAAATNELYKVAKSHGLSDQDLSAVIEALKVKLQCET